MGTTVNYTLPLSARPVHPHVRGDNFFLKSFIASWLRFTPTCVGTIYLIDMIERTCSVHPHVRGDNVTLYRFVPDVVGSPPRAWGQFSNHVHFADPQRFTPTCVGTIKSIFKISLNRAVHPHVRGDNVLHSSKTCLLGGSPPRAWGQLPDPPRLCSARRFTPTCVGTIGADSRGR